MDAPSPVLSGLGGKEDTRNEHRSRDGDDGAESGAGMSGAAEPPELRPRSRTREAGAAGGQRLRTPRAKVGGLGLLLVDTLFPAEMLWPRDPPQLPAQPPSVQRPGSSVRDGGGRRRRRGTLGARGPCLTGRCWNGRPPPCPSWDQARSARQDLAAGASWPPSCCWAMARGPGRIGGASPLRRRRDPAGLPAAAGTVGRPEVTAARQWAGLLVVRALEVCWRPRPSAPAPHLQVGSQSLRGRAIAERPHGPKEARRVV